MRKSKSLKINIVPTLITIPEPTHKLTFMDLCRTTLDRCVEGWKSYSVSICYAGEDTQVVEDVVHQIEIRNQQIQLKLKEDIWNESC